MKRLTVYVEGAGNSTQQNKDLRKGFEALFQAQRRAISNKGGRLDFIPSGGRSQTHKRFMAEFRTPGNAAVVILLVDAEEAIPPEVKGKPDANAQTRKNHLIKCDGWNLAGVPAEQLHLMVQCMEAWIVADPDAVQAFYGKNFHRPSLPSRQNLEDEPKLDIYSKLDKATSKTAKGKYAKIRHASKLLEKIDPAKIGFRCARFATFTEWLDDQIAKA